MPLSRRARWLLVLGAGLALLLTAAVLVLPSLVDVNSHRARIEAMASRAAGQPVQLGTMELSVFPRLAIRVQDVRVADPAGGAPLLSADAIDVRARLMPLLRGELDIRSVHLERPVMELTRDADGTWSIEKLAGGSTKEGRSKGAGTSPRLPETIRVGGGTVRIRVADAGAGIDLRGIDIEVDTDAKGVSAFDLSAALHAAGGDAGGRLQIAGRIVPSGAGTPYHLTLRPSDISPAMALTVLRTAGIDAPVGLKGKEMMNVEGTLDGTLAQPAAPQIAATLRVRDLSLTHPALRRPVDGVRAEVRTDGRDVSVTRFSGRLGESDIAGEISIENLDAPVIRFDLQSKQADVWDLLSFVEEDTSPAAGNSGRPAAESPPLDATGTLSIAAGRFGNLPFTTLRLGLRIRDSALRLDPFEMGLYDGTFRGSAQLDFSGEAGRFEIHGAIAGIQMNPLLKDNLEIDGALSGRLSADLRTKGRGSEPQTIIQALTGGGPVEIVDGHIAGLDVLESLSRASGVFGENTLARLSSRLKSEGSDFRRLSATLAAKGGRLSSEDLRLESEDLELAGRATLDLSRATLTADVVVLFSPELSRSMRAEKSRAAEVFWNEKRGQVSLPVKLAGPLAAPTASIDWGNAAKQLLEGKARRTLQDLLGGKRSSSDAPAGETPPPAAATDTGAADAPAPASPGDAGGASPRISIAPAAWGSSLLARDLKLSGSIGAIPPLRASLEVTDSGGRLLERIESLPLSAPGSPGEGGIAAHTWQARIEGKKLLLGRSPFRVTLQATDGEGNSGSAELEVRK